MFRSRIKRVGIILAALWCLWSILPHYQSRALEAWMLDVGQGESVLVREPGGKLLLFDGGPDDSVLQQLGDVLPPWQRHIDLVVLSHNHSDHVTGLISVLQRYRVSEAWISGATDTTPQYYQFRQELAQEQVPTRIMYFDRTQCDAICPVPIAFGQARLQVYHPIQDMQGIDPPDQHDATLSVKVSYGSESLFLTGDLNEGHEQDMLDACRAPSCTLASTVLQEPHHGSATGLLPAFLAAVHPRADLIPVGLHNKYHHPAPETLAKLSAAGIPIWRTDLQGRITVVLDGGSVLSVQPEHPG